MSAAGPAATADASVPRLLNKLELCREAGISRPTLDARLREDPDFPVVSQGVSGEEWQFDAEAALRRLAETAPVKRLSPNQQLLELRLTRERRNLAQEAGDLLVASEMRDALSRALSALSRELRSLPAALGREAGLTPDQQRRLQLAIEEKQRAFVTRLKETGLRDAG
jgi:phage terminase Nu1 subunit (DNA packaging protein)